jgi:hypothetical protein
MAADLSYCRSKRRDRGAPCVAGSPRGDGPAGLGAGGARAEQPGAGSVACLAAQYAAEEEARLAFNRFYGGLRDL